MNTIPGDEGKRTRVVERANAIQGELDRTRQAVRQFYDQIGLTAGELIKGMAYELRIVDATRAQPIWSTLEIAWENMDLAASTIETGLKQLVEALDSSGGGKSELVEATSLNTSAALDAVSAARSGLRQAIAEPEQDQIYWLSPQRSDGTTVVNAAPLRVGPILAEELFAQERSVTLTSGTLSDGRSFDRLREGVGLEVSAESMLGSPFEYRNAALVMVPEDIPEPGRPGFNEGVANAIREVALATRDRTLVLFTSNSALATARDAIREILGAEGIKVVGQGADGGPHRIMRALAENKECVALGSASLWEGVDLEAASIKTLMMARLPFPVPSQPVFEARSEQYEDSFNQFAVPEAIMKFRQGFGRLIRSRSDRGAFVILDRRVDTKRYGQRFIQALPDVHLERGGTRHVAERVKEWLDR
jgi:DNA polymerase-3 subunit epsilon/ATP-dependent DNA helicase DinG